MTVLDLHECTMARRKREAKLRAGESDRLLRTLGGKTPLQTLDTDIGASQVETVLHPVEHGLFS